ncbi:hypothetical protein SpCBS45565_g04679 [Spizellomyces sp. 'palustris']|nr:hypothetical protein SpCBS45565_g04679 [Spizellomyces sp. 'palustris']
MSQEASQTLTQLHVAIIGGGLGGLLLYQALSKNPRFSVTIYERDASLSARGQGYILGINPDGYQALASAMSQSDLDTLFKGSDTMMFLMVDHQLNVLMKIVGTPGYGRSVSVERWALRQMLAKGAPIEWGKKYDRYEEVPDGGIRAYFEDGTCITADILVGADGSRSKVRTQRCPNLVVEDVHITSIAATVGTDVLDKAPTIKTLLDQGCIRVLGKEGKTLLILPYVAEPRPDAPSNVVTGKRVVWALSFPTPSSELSETLSDPAKTIEYAVQCVQSGFLSSPDIAQLISCTTPSDVIFTPRGLLSTVPPKGNPLLETGPLSVTLLGDAAHAMTTHRGMGANTAFQDASDLAAALQAEGDIKEAIKQYNEKMMKRGITAVKASKQSTDMIHAQGTFSGVRNWMLWGIGGIMKVSQKLTGK